ncbi:hypothetical protein SH2C18_36970 [Clostridium sediminicola]|uniref:hypothetical protein n=1 Tax=Clostridium sediminicola TaxID=3114879 RepID=UPI0031F1DAD8
MKKISLVLITLIISIFTIVGCANSENSSDKIKQAANANIVNVGEKFIIEDYAEITVKDVEISNKVEPPKSTGYSLIYKSDEVDKTYVTVILEVKNLSETEKSIDNIANVSVNKEDSKYMCNLYLQLTEDDTSLSEFESIEPLSSGIVYCATKVPLDSLGESVISFLINDKKYNLNYNTTNATIEKKSIDIGQKLVAEEYAEFTIEEIEYKEDVLPSNPGDFYTHYQVENTSNIYIDIVSKIKNLRSSSYDVEKFFGAKVLYNGKYNYNGFMVGEKSDGSTLGSYLSIEPLSTMRVHSLIEVPKEVITGEVELCIYFNGEKYYYAVDKE